MASEIGQVSQAVVVSSSVPATVALGVLEVPPAPEFVVPAVTAEESWEAKLAGQVARVHATKIPGRTPKEIADELLARLLAKKQFRQVHNLNHWENYAPDYLLRLARWMAHERKKAIEAFIQNNTVGAYSLAFAVTDDSFRADWVVSDTNLELWDGRLREEFYFLAIKRNALDFMEKLGYEEEHFPPLEGGFVREGEDEDEPLRADEIGAEPGAALGLETDPLGTLIKQEDEAEIAKLLRVAKKIARKSRKYWWLRQKQWGRDANFLRKSGRKVSTKRPARPITE